MSPLHLSQATINPHFLGTCLSLPFLSSLTQVRDVERAVAGAWQRMEQDQVDSSKDLSPDHWERAQGSSPRGFPGWNPRWIGGCLKASMWS